VRITVDPGQSFLDRIIGLVEGANRQKTPNEVALHVLLSGMTIIFLIACVTLVPFGVYSGLRFSVTVIVALLVCLIPTTIGGLLSAIGIAGMDRLIRHNVIPMSGRAVEAAGDVDTMLLDKTGTITLGNRMATEFIPRRRRASRSWRTRPSSRAWPTRRPKAARSWCSPRSATACAAASSRQPRPLRAVLRADPHERLRPDGRVIRKGRRTRSRGTSARSAGACRRRSSRPWPPSRRREARRWPSPTADAVLG
jgi:hypothetical protein